MEKSIVTSGKTIDLAIDAALQQLGLDRDSVSVQVLQQAKNGFLGFGAQLAKVQVTYEAPDEEPKQEAPRSALGSASRSKPKKPAAVAATSAVAAPKAEAAPRAEEKKQEARAPREDKPRQPRPERKPQAPRAEAAPKAEAAPRAEAPKVNAEPKVYVPAEPGSIEEKIEVFLKGLLEHMGSQAVPHCWKEEEGTYKVELTGEDLGYLIGRRGDTLDALQHLTNYAVNKDVEGHVRVNVDAECYREKREDSLRRYAR